MARPELIVVVVGTATEVGKTYVGAALVSSLRRTGVHVAVRKPVQSFAAGESVTDASVLAAASGAEPDEVCRRDRSYEVAMAPPMATEVLGRPPYTVADLVTELNWPDSAEVGVVETVGGVRSPIADDGDSASLARAVEPDLVVLVADAGLGTVNAVRLSLAALAQLPVVVVLNRFDGADDLHRRNHRWLTARDRYDVVTEVDELARRVLVALASRARLRSI
jgi:dethiobiotin synthetase